MIEDTKQLTQQPPKLNPIVGGNARPQTLKDQDQSAIWLKCKISELLGKHQATIARLADSEQLEVSEVVNQYLFHMNKKQKELIEDNFLDSINSVLQLCDKAKQVKPAQWSNIFEKVNDPSCQWYTDKSTVKLVMDLANVEVVTKAHFTPNSDGAYFGQMMTATAH
jgi:hypothetical protein